MNHLCYLCLVSVILSRLLFIAALWSPKRKWLTSWPFVCDVCLVVVERLFLAVPQGCQHFVIVVFPDHTYLLLFIVILYPGTDVLLDCIDC